VSRIVLVSAIMDILKHGGVSSWQLAISFWLLAFSQKQNLTADER
jgi:hypothetical protein